ncbi:hypothetical protein GLAREA_02468 [Glarea lozoyensis ATCC 20868]|uniref:Uncharacterized protein n=1 Tax=Glarea lozoyensis (strain ATCC 20868 / MF5171) TaxID=1116229 RepID=S3CLC3_GLAL2|nr:uncharacterized protein GLAREA_02468 [Glarea lozoyensis ATCC 20868]EPE26555.1 hypothetical protein GLAREA_02468 [Glarea lozoyensis ATCC 20868]
MPSSTAFVVEGGKAAVQSFQPCHIFGDGDIYGVGVRVSFYIQFFSSIAALAANIDECITLSTNTLTIIGMALWINLMVNSTGDTLVILDWVIILSIIAFLPFYAIWRPSHYLFNALRSTKAAENLRKQEAPVQQAINQLVEIEYQEYQLVQLWSAGEDDQGRLWVKYQQAVRAYIATITIELGDANVATPTFNNGFVPISTLEDYLDHYLQKNDANDIDGADLALRLFLQKITHDMRKLLAEMYAEILGSAIISHGFVLLTWSAYLLSTPWLFFNGFDNGRKESCTIKTMDVFFIPISIYSRGHLIWLRVSSVALSIAAASGILYGLSLIYIGITQLLKELRDAPKIRRARRDVTVRTNPPASTASTEGQGDEAQAKLLDELRADAFWDEFSNDELRLLRLYWNWALPICLSIAIGTIILVEVTIRYVNHIDLSRSSITTPSQLYPLLLSIFSAVPVFLETINKFITDDEFRDQWKKAWIFYRIFGKKESVNPNQVTDPAENPPQMRTASNDSLIIRAEEGRRSEEPRTRVV